LSVQNRSGRDFFGLACVPRGYKKFLHLYCARCGSYWPHRVVANSAAFGTAADLPRNSLGRECEGFRMTAPSRWRGLHRGRRPKASREGTRGRLGTEAMRCYGDFGVLDDRQGVRGGTTEMTFAVAMDVRMRIGSAFDAGVDAARRPVRRSWPAIRQTRSIPVDGRAGAHSAFRRRPDAIMTCRSGSRVGLARLDDEVTRHD
jgi:hypothetical protein